MELDSYPRVWDDFVKFKGEIASGFDGDQDWITARISDAIT